MRTMLIALLALIAGSATAGVKDGGGIFRIVAMDGE